MKLDPYPCKDCGDHTTPCTGKRGCRHFGKWEHYMVKNEIWLKAGMEIGTAENRYENTGYLCIGCLEKRLGRTLYYEDFSSAPINNPNPWMTHRLLERLDAQDFLTLRKNAVSA